MDFFNVVIGVAMVATGVLLLGAFRGLQTGTIPKQKAYLMIVVAIVTALNLYLWMTMPEINVPN
jgi:hypothetical protein